MPSIEIVNPGVWHSSTGDVASLRGTMSALFSHGIAAVGRVQPSGKHRCIVGPGFIYPKKRESDTPESWDVLLRGHAPVGPHILNAVGIHTDCDQDLSFLKEWAYVSVRDEASAKVVRRFREDVALVPCPAMLTEPVSWEFLCAVPRYEFMSQFTPGEYFVIDQDPVLQKWSNQYHREAVTVDTRQWEVRSWKSRCPSAPATHSPEVFSAILKNAKAVICRSMHIGILSLAMGVPFVFYETDSKKMSFAAEKSLRYWSRAGLPDIIYAGKDPIGYALSLKGKLDQVRLDEMARLNEHVKRLTAACQ